jgi:Tfp pilus assembly protein PilO
MATLSGRERRLVGLAVAGALVVAGYVYVIEPIRDTNRQTAELIPAREANLERRQAMIARRNALNLELVDVSKRVEAESARFLRGPTPPLAASELQNLVKDLAANVGVEVRSERVLPTVDRGGLQEVPIEITVAANIRESVDLLYRLERTDKLLTLQDLKLRIVSAGQPRDLMATITVAGYLSTPAKSAGADRAPERPGDKAPAELGKAPGGKR